MGRISDWGLGVDGLALDECYDSGVAGIGIADGELHAWCMIGGYYSASGCWITSASGDVFLGIQAWRLETWVTGEFLENINPMNLISSWLRLCPFCRNYTFTCC